MRWLACIVVLLALGPTKAEDSAPRVLPDIRVRTVTPASDITKPCVAVPLADGVTANIPQQVLAHLVEARRKPWTNEQERLALIAGDRAQLLLAAITDTLTPEGCHVADLAIDPWSNSGHLISYLIESGIAAVSLVGTHGLVPEVHIKERDPQCKRGPWGSKKLSVPNRHIPFMSLMTCRRG